MTKREKYILKRLEHEKFISKLNKIIENFQMNIRIFPSINQYTSIILNLKNFVYLKITY